MVNLYKHGLVGNETAMPRGVSAPCPQPLRTSDSSEGWQDISGPITRFIGQAAKRDGSETQTRHAHTHTQTPAWLCCAVDAGHATCETADVDTDAVGRVLVREANSKRAVAFICKGVFLCCTVQSFKSVSGLKKASKNNYIANLAQLYNDNKGQSILF